MSAGLTMGAGYGDTKSFLRTFSPKGLPGDVSSRSQQHVACAPPPHPDRKRWEDLIKCTHSSHPRAVLSLERKTKQANAWSKRTTEDRVLEGRLPGRHPARWGGPFSPSGWRRQQSFECHRTAFQLTQKSRRFHLFLKLDAIISVNQAAANHRNLHHNASPGRSPTAACPATEPLGGDLRWGPRSAAPREGSTATEKKGFLL